MVVAGSGGARREMASQSCSTHRYSGWWWLAVLVRAERWLVNHAAHTAHCLEQTIQIRTL